MKALLELPAADLLAEIAAKSAAPAAGSAAALSGALAAALVQMVAALTVEKADRGSERLQARYGAYRDRAFAIAAYAADLQRVLQALVQEDAEGVEAVVRLRKRGEAPDGPAASGMAAEVLRQLVEVPLRIARATVPVAEYGRELFEHGYQSAAGDSDVAVTLALAATDAALAIVAANLAGARLDPDWAHRVEAECRLLLNRTTAVRQGSSSSRGENAP